MDIDIPLPGEEIPLSEIEPPDIPMPDDPPVLPRRDSPELTMMTADSTASKHSQDDIEDINPPLPPVPAPLTDDEADDPNRYSPSVPMEEDDLPITELPAIIHPMLPPPPPTRSLVLGKTQAKKRLLAFSMTKQGGGAGVSFNLSKKPTIIKESVKGFTDEKEEGKMKPQKKGTVDKARDTISEIEELKRKEMQVLEDMQTVHPHSGIRETHNLSAALPLQLVASHLKTQISIATAFLMIKYAKKEGSSPVQYTRNFQENYFRDNQDKIEPAEEQRFLNQCQDEVLQKLKKAIPAPVHQPKIRLDSEDSVVFGGGSLEWLDEWASDTGTKRLAKDINSTPPDIVPKKVFSSEENALKNIKFVESLMRIKNESKQNTSIPTSLLHSLLYDEVEHVSQSDTVENYVNNSVDNYSKQFSEDSRIVYSERFSDRSCSVNYVSGSVVKFALQSSNTDQLLVNSLKCVGKYIEKEIKTKPTEVFYNWEGSLLEYACDIFTEYSCINTNCRDELLNLILDLFEDVWCDTRLSQHRQWEMKICIANKFLAETEVCYEILQYISGKFDYFVNCVVKKSNNVPLMAEKLYLFLNLYCSVCGTIKVLQSKCKSKEKVSNKSYEDSDVTSLWREMWCSKEAEDIDELVTIFDNEIQTLERFIIQISTKYPLICTLAIEALKEAKGLCLSNESSQVSVT